MGLKLYRRQFMLLIAVFFIALAFSGLRSRAFAADVTIKFDMRGHGSQISDMTWPGGTILPNNRLPVPKADNCTFRGWSRTVDKDDWAGDQYVPMSGTYTLYARWDASSITYTFNGNGATGGSMSDLTLDAGQTKNLPANAFSRSGYTFKNWTTNADGTGTAYNNSASVTYKGNNTNSNEKVTLYAQWNRRYAPVIMATATATGPKQIQLSWTGVDDAAYYVIGRAEIGPNSDQGESSTPNTGNTGAAPATGAAVPGTVATGYTAGGYAVAKKSALALPVSEIRRVPAGQLSGSFRGHKKNFSYKFRVDAYDAQNKLICQSPEIYCYTGTMQGKSFAKRVIIDQPSVSMNLGGFRNLRADVKTKKNLDQPGYTADIRFYSDNPGVATVNSDGQIIAVATGTANIYCVAENGRFVICPINVN